MGGLAVKQIIGKEGERFDRETKLLYAKIIREIFIMSAFPQEVREKESFGDIDVLIPTLPDFTWDKKEPLLKEAFAKHGLNYQGYTKNSNIYSCAISDRQVDFIYLGLGYIEPSYYYYSNNDLGNLIGRIAHSIGLKYGNEGLQIIARDKKDHILGEVLLSTDIKEILKFLGFSSEDIDLYFKYMEEGGFPTFNDVFHWVTRSIFFDGSKYDLEELNAINRIRNVKRKTYMNFIQFLDDNLNLKSKRPVYPAYKPYWQMKSLEEFNKQPEYLKFQIKQTENEYLAELFNGDKVKAKFGLEGKQLGVYIPEFKKKYPPYELQTMTLEEIDKSMDVIYESLKAEGKL